MLTLTWLAEAQKHIGTREIPGEKNEPKILQWWKAIRRGGIKSDAVPWCAAFVGGCLEAVGIVSSRYESAKSYLAWGQPLSAPVHGCIVVFERTGGGHVGFVVGEEPTGRLMVLGGNQRDMVSIAPFDRARVAGYRWPSAIPLPGEALPQLASAQASSQEEA
ncbi:MAG: TIGR02594 family protein [Gallionellaceae bacterium]